jgi:hypothetical protein
MIGCVILHYQIREKFGVGFLAQVSSVVEFLREYPNQAPT